MGDHTATDDDPVSDPMAADGEQTPRDVPAPPDPQVTELPPRPEPVLEQARVAAAIASIAPLLLGVLVLAGQLTQGQADAVTAALVSVATGIVVLINFAAGWWRAKKARAVVTPLAAPVSALGEPLMAVTAAAALTAARDAAGALPQGAPESTPWEEDSTLVEAPSVMRLRRRGVSA